ncbi:hypothetical protein DRF65_27525 [Chryseobacterium pennae]|uniref:DUF4270 domain-containing protein n=1 Tax=Chryseobacterium pennae TaxID=2258962 RepID=A0A3D9C097_9FLAO|nr:DUF4270 family protein [Chryseobacterium pennae]REC59159.1 hypothetical protein DRF65_27525 [Chryseobacterium pennae]
MTHTLKRTFAMLLLAVFGSAILYNCEPDPDSLGKQLFDQDAATGNESLREVIAYNISNNDSIRSDAARLLTGVTQAGSNFSAVLGAFNEGQFGMQKASYITQLRMPVDNFDFDGPKPQVDSVVLVLKTPANTAENTYYIADSLKAPGAYDKDDFMIGTEKVPVSIEKKSYPVRKYGRYVKSMKINVNEITTFLNPNMPDVFSRSNVTVGIGDLLGSASFDGNISTVTVTKRSDNSNVFTGALGFRMPLDKDFFQKRIIDKKGSADLKDAANFTRYFKGIRISVEDKDGYLFQISPNDTDIIMYYKYDKTDNGVVTRPQTSLKFNLGSINTHIGQYEYERSATYQAALQSPNKTEGDKVLFLQGMGGASIGLKIPDSTIDSLRQMFVDKKAGIVGAKIRLFVDKKNTWTQPNFTDADRKFIVSPITFKDDKVTIDYSKWAFTSDSQKGFPIYYYKKNANNEVDYYDFTVTQALKDIVEVKDYSVAKNAPLIINAGGFVKNPAGAAYGPLVTTRATDMNRMVFIGTDKTKQSTRARLRVTYSTNNK